MQRFAPYLLDRLMDAAPEAGREAVAPALTIEQLKDTVARDVEDTPSPPPSPPSAAGSGARPSSAPPASAGWMNSPAATSRSRCSTSACPT